MKVSGTSVFAVIAATMLFSSTVSAQNPKILPAQNFYYDDYEWPLPGEGTSTMTLSGMKSVHAVWMTFIRYTDGKPITDAPIITLLEGSTVRWSAPQGGCSYELQLVNTNPPLINMHKPPSICALRPGGKVIFKVLATP